MGLVRQPSSFPLRTDRLLPELSSPVALYLTHPRPLLIGPWGSLAPGLQHWGPWLN